MTFNILKLTIVNLFFFHFSREICNISKNSSTGNIDMCRICDQYCDFWTLNDSCFTSKIAFLFDNPLTVVFAIAMSFWGTFNLRENFLPGFHAFFFSYDVLGALEKETSRSSMAMGHGKLRR